MTPYMSAYEDNWLILMDWIESMQALSTVIKPYFMDPVDLDSVDSFV
jgi:hypothetical protein